MSALDSEAPFINLVLECNQAEDSDGDSFSTLGLHSIFSEDDHRNAGYYKKREQWQPKSKQQLQQQPQQPKRKCPSPALGKFLVESSEDDEDEMDLKALLRRGSRLVDGFTKSKGLHNSFSNLETAPPTPKFQGNRWLESTGRSVSCKNLGYESESSCGSRRSRSDAIAHPKSRELSTPPPPLQPLMAMMDASCASDSIMDASAMSEAEDIDASTPSRSARRTKSLGAGLSKGSRRTVRSVGERSKSTKERGRQTPETAPCTPMSTQGATDKALRALVKQNSFVNLNPSSPESRKTMLSMGKSVSSRNLMLNSDSKPISPQRPMMKSKSVRHLSAAEKEEEYVPPVFAVTTPLSPTPLTPSTRPQREVNRHPSPGSRPRRHSRSRRLAEQKSKSARHFTQSEREEDTTELTFSPPARSIKLVSSVPREQATFNGRKFMSYSKSLSCRDLSSRSEEELTKDQSLTMPRRQQTIERPSRYQADGEAPKGTQPRDHSLTPPKRMAERPSLKITLRPTTPASEKPLKSRPSTPASEAPTLKRSTVSEAFKSRPSTPASEAPTLKRSTVSEAFKSRPSTPASEAPTLKRSTVSEAFKSRPTTPASEVHKRRASRPNTPASTMDLPSLTLFADAHRPSSASRPTAPAAVTETPTRSLISTFRSRPNTLASTMERPSLQKRAVSERALTVSRPLTVARPMTPCAALHDTPSGSSMQKSLSLFLQKRVESEKITTAVEAIPGRRSKLAKIGMSKSARNLVDGRKSKLSMGKSLSARSLVSTDGSLSELSPIPASPCVSVSDLSKQQESVNLSVCQEESSKNGMDESTPGSLLDTNDDLDFSMPGLSPMTPLKTPSISKPPSSPLCALSVVGEESLSQIVPSLPLGNTDSDGACASNDSDEADMYQTTTVESESEEEADSDSEEETEATGNSEKSPPKEYKLGFSDSIAPQEFKLGFPADDKPAFSTEEICKDMGLSTSEALSPIREAGGKALVSCLASRRASSSRRLSAHKESKSPSAMSPRASFQGNTSSLKAALQKAVSAVNADGRRPSTSGRSFKRTTSHDGRSSLRKSVSHDSTVHEDRKASYKKTMSFDSTASSMHENSKKSYRRTVSRDSTTNRSSSTRGSGKAKSQDGSKKAGRRSLLSKQSSVSARSSQEKKASSLKAALDKSQNDASVQGKKSSSRRSSSTNKRRESVNGRKEERRESLSGRKDERQRSSRNLIRKESQRNMGKRESQRNLIKKESQRNMVKKESQRTLVRKESQRNMSSSHQGVRQRASVGPSDKSMSKSAHSAGRRRSSRTAAADNSVSVSMGGESKQREMNVSNSSSQPSQGSGSRHKKRRQRSSRRLLIEEPADPESNRSRSSSKGVNKKERKRRSTRPTAEELRADSPSCVTEYSAGEKASQLQGKRAKESRKKRSSLPTVSPPRPCLKRPDRNSDERNGTSLRDIRAGAPRTNSGSSHRDLDPRSDRSHGSWSTADFSSVVW